MRVKIEGILLSRQLFKERDLIGQLLLRNGKRVTVLFYGGQGGGRKQQTSPLELGHLVHLEINRFARNHQGMYSSREYIPTWFHRHLRHDYPTFCLLCFYLELVSKIAPEDQLTDHDAGNHHQGLFRVLANAIYHLEHSRKSHPPPPLRQQMVVFLAKLIIELGITPNLHHCLYSERNLSSLDDFQLIFEQGGFVGGQFLSPPRTNHRTVWEILSHSWKLPYPQAQQLAPTASTEADVLCQYLLFQTHLNQSQLKTLPSVL